MAEPEQHECSGVTRFQDDRIEYPWEAHRSERYRGDQRGCDPHGESREENVQHLSRTITGQRASKTQQLREAIHPFFRLRVMIAIDLKIRDFTGLMRLLRLARGIGAIVVVSCKLVEAQSALGVGALRGTVLDGSEGVVGGATVTLTETSKGLVRTSESAGDGSFLFASVIAGVYSIRVECRLRHGTDGQPENRSRSAGLRYHSLAAGGNPNLGYRPDAELQLT